MTTINELRTLQGKTVELTLSRYGKDIKKRFEIITIGEFIGFIKPATKRARKSWTVVENKSGRVYVNDGRIDWIISKA
jgi:hypothetical protein